MELHNRADHPSGPRHKAIPTTCGLHRGPIGFANLMVSIGRVAGVMVATLRTPRRLRVVSRVSTETMAVVKEPCGRREFHG
jgi:hypothetical protein